MDDDCKEYRKNKPQQRFYKPGSGPLRRSSYGLDTKMDIHDIDNSSRRYRSQYGSQYSINDDVSDTHSEHSVPNTRRNLNKPEHHVYMPKSSDSCSNVKDTKTSVRYDNSSHYNNRSNNLDKHGSSRSMGYNKGSKRDRKYYSDYHNKDNVHNDINSNRHYRQTSETRSISPSHSIQEQKVLDRNRDSKSMETSAGRHMSSSGGKPPSGRRNSAGYMSDTSRPKYMLNLDNIPPRFRKKFFEQSAQHRLDNTDQAHRDKSSSNYSLQPSGIDEHVYNSHANWSQTLPSRGRGRLREHEGFDREKFINTYLKTSETQNSRRSTPSNSYMNLYESTNTDHRYEQNKSDTMSRSTDSQSGFMNAVQQNGLSNMKAHVSSNCEKQNPKRETECEHDKEATQLSTTLLDLTNLDWTEEVEKNIQLDEMCDTSSSFSQNIKNSNAEEIKSHEPKESKRSGRSRRKDRRSSSRGVRNVEKKERNRKDSTASVQHDIESSRKDSNVSMHNDIMSTSLRRRERERRDSHRSNRSSTIGNSRDDLDRWRSLRSYSREQSTEGRLMSQCNSRDTSLSRALSPRDNDGFRVPSAVNKPWSSANQKNNASDNGRTSSTERGRQSPGACGMSGVGGGGGGVGGADGGGGRRSKRRTGRRRGRPSDAHAPPAPPTPAAPAASATQAAPTAPAALTASHTSSEQHTPATTATSSTTAAPLSWREEIIESKRHNAHEKHVESKPGQRKRLNSGMSEKSETSNHYPGLIMLPHGSITHLQQKDVGRGNGTEHQKTLYDHHNPSKPIIVQTSPTKVDMRMERGVKETSSRNTITYESNEAARAARHRSLLQEVDRADVILQAHMLKGPVGLADHWSDVIDTRTFLQNALQRLLMSDLKYCQADNVEHHFWKILYYNFIEILRKSFPQISPNDKPKIVQLINTIIEEGNTFFENLVQMLEKAYKFNVEDYLNDSHAVPPKGLGYVGLALISVQKLYVYLGDLARYKEQVNETNNYAKSKLWYTKAQQINPKNGRPYNQLAILAIYARRKLDAVYYYMRSLMSSNPLQSARESLLSLFDENRKKYEAAERKRRAAVESCRSTDEHLERDHHDDHTNHADHAGPGEVWLRPGHVRDSPRTPHNQHSQHNNTLANMTSVELNKNFITSYLHVHGKLITKIGMESFHECAGLMLRQFRALLHRQPLPMPAARLLQLTALNMFAVETTAPPLKERTGSGERSAWLECALSVSLLMFGALVERCCALLLEPPHTQQNADALILLPAIKVWSDWMLCHSNVWNPPPSFDKFQTETENDPWDWLAKFMNILESLDDKSIGLENEAKDGDVCVRLGEDATLGGFTPLMYMEPAVAYCAPNPHHHHLHVEHALRTRKLLFFGTEYLVGVEPPVLRLEYAADAPPRYVSAVVRTHSHTQTHAHAHAHTPHHPHHTPLRHQTEVSEDEGIGREVASGSASVSVCGETVDTGGADEATRSLLRRKEQLENKKATLERHRQRVQEILGTSSAEVTMEVRPRWLVPDTNCFIDHLELIRAVASAPSQPYTLAVPLVVLTELEGLRKCSRVGGAARDALAWLTGVGGGAGGSVRLATTRGSLLTSRAFTAEREHERATNDDRVLATALNLHKNLSTDTGGAGGAGGVGGGDEVRRVREVVLLTEDRNLRVKALAAELPARDLPSFVHWAGLHPQHNKKSQSQSADEDAAERK